MSRSCLTMTGMTGFRHSQTQSDRLRSEPEVCSTQQPPINQHFDQIRASIFMPTWFEIPSLHIFSTISVPHCMLSLLACQQVTAGRLESRSGLS